MPFPFFGQNQAPVNPAPSSAPAPATAPASEPLNSNPAPSAPPSAAAPAAPAAPAPAAPAAPSLNLADLLLRPQQSDPNTPVDPMQQAHQFLSSLGAGDPNQSAQPAVRINEQALREAMSEVNLTDGVDWTKFNEALQTGQGTEAALQTAMQTQGLNVLTAMTPVINMLVEQAVQNATQQAVTQSQHSLTSSSIVTAMRDTYEYASNPVASMLIESIANQVAPTLPPNTPMRDVVSRIDELFRTMSSGLTADPTKQTARSGVQSGFTGLFNS